MDHREEALASESYSMGRFAALAVNPVCILTEEDITDLTMKALLGANFRFGHSLHEFRFPGLVAPGVKVVLAVGLQAPAVCEPLHVAVF